MTTLLPPHPELDYQTVLGALGDYAAPRKALADLISRGQITRVKKGIYVQSGRGIALFSREILANMIYGPSYISYEYGLSFHGLIPEQVTMVTCATMGKTKTFTTPVGTFRYVHQGRRKYAIGYYRSEIDGSRGFLIAGPEKSLADRIAGEPGRFSVRTMREFLFENLRIEPQDFYNLDSALLSEIASRSGRRSLFFLNKLKRSKI